MKIYTIAILMLAVVFTSINAADLNSPSRHSDKHFFKCFDDKDVDYSVKNGTVILKHYQNSPCTVSITESGTLYIDDREIAVDKQEQKLLKKFNRRFRELMVSVDKLEEKATRLGKKGALIGLHAVSNVFASLDSREQMEELEDEIQEKVEKIEEEADELEEEAEGIEEAADEIEALHEEMVDRIPELRELYR